MHIYMFTFGVKTYSLMLYIYVYRFAYARYLLLMKREVETIEKLTFYLLNFHLHLGIFKHHLALLLLDHWPGGPSS